jgi:hypothetical protein
MWKFFGIFLVVILAVTVGYLAHAVQTEAVGIRLFAGSQLTASYPDLIAIILTAFGVIMAIASIALGTAAIIGWHSIEAKAMRTAADVIKGDLGDADGRLHKLLKEAISNTNSPLHKTLKIEAQKLMYSGVLNFENGAQYSEEENEPS